MKLDILGPGIFDSLTYILSDNEFCAIVDCGVPAEQVLGFLKKEHLKAQYIILTHGHVDHIFYLNAIREETNARLCIHENELELYSDYEKNGCFLLAKRGDVELPKPDILLKDGQMLKLESSTLEISPWLRGGRSSSPRRGNLPMSGCT